MYKKLLFIAILSCFFMLGCGGGSKIVKEEPVVEDTNQYIEVEGEAEVAPTPENLLVTKKEALEAAKRKALENALGVYITGQQMVSKAMMIQEKIFSKTAGYIKDYKILKEGMNGEFYKTRIWAKIGMSDVKNDIDALGLMIRTSAGNPRVVVIIDEVVDGIVSGDSNAETKIMGLLLTNGYKVVDQQQLDKIKQDDTLKAAAAGDEKAASVLSKKFDADVAIIGKVNVKTSKNMLVEGAITSQAVMNAKVVQASTGVVLFAVNKTGSIWDITKEMAISNSIIKVSESSGKEFVDKIAVQLAEASILKLVVSPLESLGKVEEFRRFLKTYENVNDVTVRSFVDDTAELEVEAQYGSASDFASKIEKTKKYKIKIKEAGGHSITAEIQK